MENMLTHTMGVQPFVSLYGNWEQKKDRLFCADEVIDAYLKGKQEGKHDLLTAAALMAKKNLEKTLNFSETIFKELKGRFNINVDGMRVRIKGAFDFETLFIISEKDFLSDDINTVYQYLFNKMQEVNTSQYSWSYVVMPKLNAEINIDAIESDGFVLAYAGNN